MFEHELLDILVRLATGLISFSYSERFLVKNYDDRRRAAVQWTLIFALIQFVILKLTETWSPYNRFFNIVPLILLLLILQDNFFERCRPKQIFVIASFIAGWEILAFTASPLAHAIFSVYNPIWEWAVNKSVELYPNSIDEMLSLMQNVNRVAVFIILTICRVVQLALLILYLRFICRAFIKINYDLRIRDSLFLIFPCVTVLVIDLTVRLMVISVDNSAIMLIYDRVPATVLLLPLVSLLLLGIVISSVIMFQNFAQYKEEEQRRLLLENRVVEVHREIEELQDIYSDIRGLRHDLRDHIANISAYLKTLVPNDTQINNYINRMNETVSRLEFTDHTGNPITDIIIYQARQQAIKQKISFEANFNFPRNSKIDVYDISIILNNALKNALEACAKINDNRMINVKSYMKGNLFFIETENTFDGKLNWQSDLPKTSKADKNFHGIGLANIKKCAQKYLGALDIKITNEQGVSKFNLTVMLYKTLATFALLCLAESEFL